jgi:peptidoglycan/LPS O-acetylase OafA/YrhL
MTSPAQPTEIPALHALKAIAACGVILAHCIGSPIREPLLHVCKLAVPLFFFITGYFLVQAPDFQIDRSRLLHKLRRILRMTVCIQLFYFLSKWWLLTPERLEVFTSKIQQASFWWHFLWIGDNFCGPLWYLHALIECLVILYLCVRFRLLRLLPILAVLGFLLNMALGKFAFLWHPEHFDFFVHRNALTIGLPAIYCGMLIRRYGAAWFERRSARVRLGLMLLALFLLTAENGTYFLAGIRGYGDVSLLTLPTALCVFGWALYSPWLAQVRPLVFVGRNLSANIFLFHSCVIFVLERYHLVFAGLEWVEVTSLTICVCLVIYWVRSFLKGF